MMSYLLVALAVLVGAVVLLLVVAAMRPADFRITRSLKMSGPPAAPFKLVNDFHLWESWSPWAKLDPNMQHEYSGPDSGVGACHAWKGNNKVGEGRTTITESRPDDLIRIKLEFLRPWVATNDTEFTFRADGDQTLVTWSMTGTNNFMAKVFGLLMNMDKMVGRDFEKGLAAMKELVEASKI